MNALRRWPAAAVLLGAVLAGLAGCAGMSDVRQTDAFIGHYAAGEFAAASEVLGGDSGLDYAADHLLTSLHVAMALRAGARLADSQVAFDRAESQLLWKSDRITTFDDALGAGLSLVGNDLLLAYRGTIYDGVLVNTYKAMNALALGDVARARVELNRADQRQDNAVHQLAVKVSALAASDAEGSGDQYVEQVDQTVDQVMDPDGAVGQRLAAVEALGSYRDLRNPFTDWLHGVFRLATGEANRASDLLRNAVALNGRRNRHVLADLLAAERAAQGAAGSAERVWVVHEDGVGPYLEQFRFTFFVPTENGPIAVGIALPELHPGTPAFGALEIRAGGHSSRTEPLLEVDRYVATEFRAGYDTIVVKAVASAVIRILLQVELQRRTEGQGLFGSLLRAIVPAVAAGMTQADTRMWRALPHTIGVASLPRPADGRLRFAAVGSPTIAEVALPPGKFVLVTVTTTRRGAPPALNTISLAGGP